MGREVRRLFNVERHSNEDRPAIGAGPQDGPKPIRKPAVWTEAVGDLSDARTAALLILLMTPENPCRLRLGPL